MNEKIIDIDKYVILLLPIALVITLLVLPENLLFFSTGLIIGLFIYEMVIYKYRWVYGFSGLKILAAPAVILFSFTAFIAIPSIYVCSIKNNPAIYPYFYSIISFYFLYPAGLFFSRYFWNINPEKTKRLWIIEFKSSKFDSLVYEILVLLLSFGLLILIDFLIRLKTIPLFELFRNVGDYLKLIILREEALKLLPATFIEKYFYQWQRSFIMPMGIVSSLFLYMRYKRRKYLILFSIFIISGLFFNSLTLEKSPIAAIFLSLVAFVYLRKKKISLKFIIASIILIFLGPATIMFLKYYRELETFRLVYVSMLYRIFIVPAEALYYYFEIFPTHHPFLLGRTSHLFSWLHDAGLYQVANYVFRYWWNSPYSTGFANANYLGNFWADFGAIGVVLSNIFVGFLVNWFYAKILKICNYQKNIVYVISSTITIPVLTFNFFSSNFTTLIFTRGLFPLVVLLVVLNYLVKKESNVQEGVEAFNS